MSDLQKILPSNLFEVVERSGLTTIKKVLLLSIWDIKKLTNLNLGDIKLIKSIVSDNIKPEIVSGNNVLKGCEHDKVTTGCVGINKLLLGGLRRGTITEIFGESGSGKSQFAIQSAIHNWQGGCVYICTEEMFPTKRYEQMKQSLPEYSISSDFGKNIFIEHVTETHELVSCIKMRLPKLLLKNKLSLVVIDSIAAPYRSETTNYVQRAEELKELAVALITLAQEHNLAVLCVNQVTATFDESDTVIPSLGLAWSNVVSTRLSLKKTDCLLPLLSDEYGYTVYIRELAVVFAPNLINNVSRIYISPTGIRSIDNMDGYHAQ